MQQTGKVGNINSNLMCPSQLCCEIDVHLLFGFAELATSAFETNKNKK